MLFSKNYFKKENIEDITYDDVVNFFKEERQESDKIEYKSFVISEKNDVPIGKKIDGVIKSITGFLNSDGGLLIWGAPSGKKLPNKIEKIFIGELSLVNQLYEKDQLISKISDRITPLPRGILFHRIENNKKYIYLFEIPKSEYSPHQFDNRFYMRIDGQSKPAPYHYVEALFKQIKFPKLNVYLKLFDWKKVNDDFQLIVDIVIFNHSKLENLPI